jgi:hypothetical protein
MNDYNNVIETTDCPSPETAHCWLDLLPAFPALKPLSKAWSWAVPVFHAPHSMTLCPSTAPLSD